jgi:hypothetical protein
LDKLYPAGESRSGANFQFDQSFEDDASGAYSCDLQMRPFELRSALDKFRNGVLYRDSRSIAAVVNFPIQAHVSDSLANAKVKTITIRNVSEWYSFQDRYFTPIQKALVACSYLGNVTPMGGGRSPGVMIGLGAFWFQSFVGSWKVKVTAVNIDPITPDIIAKSCIPPGAERN